MLGPDRPARVVDGLLTGLHEAEASHLDLLRAVAGDRLVEQAYRVVTHGPRALPLARVRRHHAVPALTGPDHRRRRPSSGAIIEG